MSFLKNLSGGTKLAIPIAILIFIGILFYVIKYKIHSKEYNLLKEAEEKRKSGIIEKEKIINTAFFNKIKEFILNKNIEVIKENVLKDLKHSQNPKPKQTMLAYQSVIVTPTALYCYRPIYYMVFEIKYSDFGLEELSEKEMLGLSFALEDIGHKVIVEPYFNEKNIGATIRIETDFKYWYPYIKKEIDETLQDFTNLPIQ